MRDQTVFCHQYNTVQLFIQISSCCASIFSLWLLSMHCNTDHIQCSITWLLFCIWDSKRAARSQCFTILTSWCMFTCIY